MSACVNTRPWNGMLMYVYYIEMLTTEYAGAIHIFVCVHVVARALSVRSYTIFLALR